MKELRETLKKRKKKENALKQVQIYEKYCLNRKSKKKYIEATNQLYSVASDLAKKLRFK